ncbi:ABC transporter ATP-binding protein [Thalassobacillus devorans]|uniref:ABC transporter ATP-binding protein n=1 Tax=Thalassobacillus devorans TaxID=279813 RepID=UPI0004B63136|nr:ABC transporter ATP-binding protein [Thalassobacillus devorans]
MIRTEQLKKRYKQKQILHDLSLDIKAGESVGITGPNGAGKTTLLKLLATIEKPTCGALFFEEKPYSSQIKTIRKRIGYIPQDISLFEGLRVKAQINAWRKLSAQTIDDTYMNEMIRILRLNEVMNRRSDDLSGGWKRKLHLCIGLLHKPEICLLDEPTAGIDMAAKVEIIDWLKKLNDAGMTLVYISHDWYELERLSKRLVLMDNGSIVFNGEKRELKDLPANEFSRELANIIHAGKKIVVHK